MKTGKQENLVWKDKVAIKKLLLARQKGEKTNYQYEEWKMRKSVSWQTSNVSYTDIYITVDTVQPWKG